jgi:arylsulfatase A-like enzyme
VIQFFSGGSQVFLIAVWFGLAAGLLEGLTAVLLRGVPGFSIVGLPEILWIAPGFNLTLFLLMNVVLDLLFYRQAKGPQVRQIVSLFSWVTLFGFLLLVHKLHQGASLILSLGLALQIGRWLRGREQRLLSFLKHTVGPMVAVSLLASLVGIQWDSWRERFLVGQLPQPQTSAPNLLLITLDTLRADHVSAYRYERLTTPNIDRLARGGTLFEYAFANSSWTLPTHASLFTGRFPYEHKADWWDPLDGKYPTLAEALASRGYVTAAFAANTHYVTPEWGLARGFTRFKVYGSSFIDDSVRTVYGKKLATNILPRLGYFDIPGRKRALEVNREFFHWLDGIKGRPFFAFLNYLDVHDPYLTVAPYQSKFSQEVTRGDRINFQFRAHAFRHKPVLTTQEIQTEVDSYDGCLAYLDTQLGVLFSELAKRSLDKNTLMIVTSDHGESFGNHDLFGHGNGLYLETLHVPLIFYWPGRIPSGARVSRVVSLHQIPSTIMELFGETASPSFAGRSLASLWAAVVPDASGDPILSELSPGRFKGSMPHYPAARGGLKSLITDQWHFILSESGQTELYAWREDTQESHDLASSPLGQVVVEELKRELHDLLKLTGAAEQGNLSFYGTRFDAKQKASFVFLGSAAGRSSLLDAAGLGSPLG